MDEEKGDQTISAPPAIPYSIFTPKQKALIIAIVSIAATFSAFASNIYFPSIPAIARDLSVTPELINLTVTSYMILQGLAPSIWGALADVHGRRLTYFITFTIFIGACVGLAETKHYYQLVILRCLQSTGSASTIAIGAGVVGDITTRAERGGYMGIFQAGLLAPLSVGPILGGIFSQTLGWRAIFWFLTIYGGAVLILLGVLLPETLRCKVGNGSVPAKGISNSLLAYIQRRRHPRIDEPALERSLSTSSAGKQISVDFLGPLKIIFSIEVTFVIIFLSIYYTVWQMTVAVMSTLFSTTYGLSEIQIGLTYLANGVACVAGTLTTGKFLDYDYQRFKKSYEGPAETFPLDRVRLRTIWLWGGMQIASSLAFGWTMERHVHVSVPIICTFFLGWAATSIISTISTFMVDIFPKKGASATAAVNFVRCLMGAGGTASVLPTVNRIGVGWTFTLWSGVMLVALGLILLQMVKGREWRRRREMLNSSRS
ncbi:MFS general substrate transporter [Stipitochalara longipes BDJ]|nr:MFS general substrate transporter [Stipitochalara longipes BDJ]